MKFFKLVSIFFTIIFSFLTYIFLIKSQFLSSFPEYNMNGCIELNITTKNKNCITSQVKYDKWIIMSSCKQCNCQKYGFEFLYLDLKNNNIEVVEVEEFDKEKKLLGSSMSVYDQRLFVLNELENAVENFEIIKTLLGPLLTYKYSFTAIKDQYQIQHIHALSEFEALITAENINQENYSKISHLLDYFSTTVKKENKTTSVFYTVYNHRTRQSRSELVEGLENCTRLSGITKSQYPVFIAGMPDEDAVAVFRFVWMQGIGMQLTKKSSLDIGFEVQGIAFDEKLNASLLIENSKQFQQYACWGNIYELIVNEEPSNEKIKNYSISYKKIFAAKQSICNVDSVVHHNGNYYLASSYQNKYLICKK